jgi:HTH-type transcriptional regulator, transcriptional repressor of NAD biosynthesis genes
MSFERGVVIGKFYPPHRGHKFLIDTATSQAKQVTAIVCERTTDEIPGEIRAQWLRETHPALDVLVVEDRYDPDDSKLWADNTVRWLGWVPDVVFTSEDYGERYAEFLGCTHILVDRERTTVPCSGTAIRNDPSSNWEFIEPPVRAWFAKRVCVLGAESSGTTTIAEALAAHYRTAWVPEYGRDYCAEKYARDDRNWRTEEFTTIALEQSRREEAAARRANRLLICDTNAFATGLWHRRYLGSESDELKQIAGMVKCDLYLLTDTDIPFVQDGLRDGEHIRQEMHSWFISALNRQRTRWHMLSGPLEVRLKKAVRFIDALFRNSR